MQAVVLAGGNTSRLQTVAAGVPKPLLPLFDQPVLEHTLKHLAAHGIKDIIICLSDAASEIADYFGNGSRWGLSIRYSVEHEPVGTAGAVRMVGQMIKDTFVVLPADIVTDIDISEAAARHYASSALASILLHQANEPTQYGMVVHDRAGKVTHFLEKPRSGELPGNTISTGIYILEPEALSSIPYGESCDFALHVFPRLLNNREPLYGFDLHGYWCDTGDLIDYHKMHFDVLAGKLRLELRARQVLEGVWVGERAEISPSSEIGEMVYLGAGARVEESTVLRGKVVVGENSVIGSESELYRSVIGCNSRIGRNSTLRDCIIGNGYDIEDHQQLSSQIMVSDSVYEIKPAEPGVKTKSKPKQRLHQIMDAPVLG